MDVEDGEQCDGDPDDGMEDSSDEDPAVAAEAGPAGDSRQSLSESELFKAYKTVGPHKMYMDIMCDDDLFDQPQKSSYKWGHLCMNNIELT